MKKHLALGLWGSLIALLLVASLSARAEERVVENSIEIAAPVAKLWKAFTDPAEYKRWAGGVMAVDLRTGGSFEASYDSDGKIGAPDNIRHRILGFVPDRMIVFQNIQSPGLPGEELYRGTAIVVAYKPLGPKRTEVTVSHVGFGEGEGYDKLAKFFKAGDARMLATMKKAYEK